MPIRRTALWVWSVLGPLLLLPIGCRQNPAALEGEPTVRVCLLQNVEHVNVTSNAQVLARSGAEPEARRLNFPNGMPVLIALAPEGWHVGNIVLGGGELTIQPAFDGAVTLDGKPYRGEYRFVPVAPGRFDVVNDVKLESYLKGVLPGELPAAWNIEAYKAQAITARTYALYEIARGTKGRPYDVFDDTRSQVYDGMKAETPKSAEAADETGGVVVAYGTPGQERIFKAYFSSCCGGVGQSVTDAFNEDPIPPLVEKGVGGLCNASPKYNWPPIVMSKSELTRRIRSWGARRNRPEKDIPQVTRIDISALNQFGRPVRFLLTDSRGTRYSLSGEEIRWACNADANGGPTLPSSFFKPVNEPEAIRFVEGHGFGHAVGLCQWCAEAQAEQGMRHEDIVLLAFPRARLIRAY
jgi:stage II sporulation protein D